MLRLCTIVVVGLLAAGCLSSDRAAVLAHSPWGANTKGYLNAYKHVLAVCVYKDSWEDRGLGRFSLHHYRGTVVRTFKGNWNLAERIAFVHGVDAPALQETNADAGSLVFVFTNEHAAHEIALDTGDFGTYDTEFERILEFIFPRRNGE
jgi:hypothetical protein